MPEDRNGGNTADYYDNDAGSDSGEFYNNDADREAGPGDEYYNNDGERDASATDHFYNPDADQESEDDHIAHNYDAPEVDEDDGSSEIIWPDEEFDDTTFAQDFFPNQQGNQSGASVSAPPPPAPPLKKVVLLPTKGRNSVNPWLPDDSAMLRVHTAIELLKEDSERKLAIIGGYPVEFKGYIITLADLLHGYFLILAPELAQRVIYVNGKGNNTVRDVTIFHSACPALDLIPERTDLWFPSHLSHGEKILGTIEELRFHEFFPVSSGEKMSFATTLKHKIEQRINDRDPLWQSRLGQWLEEKANERAREDAENVQEFYEEFPSYGRSLARLLGMTSFPLAST